MANTYDAKGIHGKELLDFGTEIAKKIRTDDEVIAASLNNLNSRLEAFENIDNWGDILADSINTSEFPLVAGKPMVVVKAGTPSGTSTIPDYAGQFYVDSTNKVIYCSGGYSSVNDWVDVTNKIGTGTVGSATKPIYLSSGTPTAGSDYAGGTKVTLNGTDKGASTATIYAPTTAGTNNYVLKSNGSGEPSWVEKAPKASAADTATTATDYNTSTGTIKSGLDSKVNIANISLNSQTTTLLEQVRNMVAAGKHYARFFTTGDASSANISDKPVSGNNGFLCEVMCNRGGAAGSTDYRYLLTCWVKDDTNPYVAVVTQNTTTISWDRLNKTLSHAHGNITNAGAIGSTSGNAVYTTTNGVLTAGSLASNDPTAEGTTITAIDTLSQDAKGKVTATKKTIRSATTSQTGVVQLNDNINSTSTTEAATANAVKKAYDKANGKQDPITFDGTYNASTNKAATVSTVTTAVSNAVNGLDATVTSSDGTNIQVKVTETDGKITAVNVTTDNTANKTHAHGNIQSGGTLQTNDVTIASGDKLVITDSSDSNKVARASISFDGSTTTQALTKAGTWATFNNYSHPAGSAASKTGVPTADAAPAFGGTFKVNQITTDDKSHVASLTERTITIPNTTGNASTAGLAKLYTGTGTNTDGTMTQSAIKTALDGKVNTSALTEANVNWGGNFRTSLSPTEMALMPMNIIHNPLPDAVIFEKTTDGGTTWSNVSKPVAEKLALCNLSGGSTTFDISNSEYSGISNITLLKARITVYALSSPTVTTAESTWYYGQVQRLLMLTSMSGAGKAKIECRKWNDHIAQNSTWSDLGTYDVRGDSGWNSIPISVLFGGYTSQLAENRNIAIRITFWVESGSTPRIKILRMGMPFSISWINRASTLNNNGLPVDVNSDGSGTVQNARKLDTARKLAVNLANTSTDSTFDGSADQTGIKVSGTLPIANGGTGATTAKAAEYAISGGIAQATATLQDNYHMVFSQVGDACNPTNGVFLYRTTSTVWNYMKGKMSSDTGVNISGNAATATSAGKLTTARKTYTDLGTSSNTTTKDWSGDTVIPVYGQLKIANGGTGSSTAAGARTNLDVYSKSEVDSMLTGRISIVTSLPATGEAGVIYFVGPTGSGSDKYEEYVWDGSAFVKVGEKSLDLSNYVNTLTVSGTGNAVTAISKSGNTITATVGNVTFTQPQLGQGYGTCGTTEATAAKTVTLSDFVLKNGGIVAVKFTYALCASATLNVNSTGAKPVLIAGAAPTSSTCKAVQANDIAYFIYDGTSYHFLGTERASRSSITNITRSGTTFTATRADGSTFTFTQQDNNTTYTQEKLGQGYGTCTTAEATAAKAVSLTNYELVTNGIIAVKFSYGLCASATLNVNSKGAKPIYIQGAAVSSTTAKEVLAGDIALFMYDGSQYQFLCSDRLSKDAIAGLSISGKTITYTKADGTTGTLTTQDTTYTFDGTYDSSTNKAATVSTVTNKIAALDVSDISGFGAGKTLATLTETDGKIAATFQNISITKSQVSDFPTSMTPTSHASSATTYGIGTTANYGHVKLATGDMNGATHADGVAVSKNHTHSQYQTVLTEMTETEVDDLLASLT